MFFSFILLLCVTALASAWLEKKLYTYLRLVLLFRFVSMSTRLALLLLLYKVSRWARLLLRAGFKHCGAASTTCRAENEPKMNTMLSWAPTMRQRGEAWACAQGMNIVAAAHRENSRKICHSCRARIRWHSKEPTLFSYFIQFFNRRPLNQTHIGHHSLQYIFVHIRVKGNYFQGIRISIPATLHDDVN